MARIRIKGHDLEKETSKILSKYGDGVIAAVAPSVEEVARDTVQQLRTTGEYEDRTGDYRKSFAYIMSKTFKGATGIVYSEAPDYRLTHLLEHGTKSHLMRGGTERHPGAKPFPHWKPAEQKAVKGFKDRLRKNIEKVKA